MAASISYQSATSQGGGGPYSIALTVASAAGQERLIALSAITGNADVVTLSGVTIDGQTATQVGPYARGSGTSSVLSIWRAPGSSGTSINVTATTSHSTFDLRCLLWSLIDAGTVLDTASVGVDTATTTQALDLDTAADGVVVAATMAFNGGTASATWTGLTERFDGLSLYGSDCTGGADAATASASTPLSITVTWGYAGTFHAAGLAVSFNPAATGIILTAADGSYALTGSPAGLVISSAVKLVAAAGAYALTGTPALLVKSGSVSVIRGGGTIYGTFTVPEEIRLLVIAPEDRTIEIPAEWRVIEVQNDPSK